mgnify:CR=1 FL=1
MDARGVVGGGDGEGKKGGIKEGRGVSRGTADAQGCPTARMVLLKGHDERGFVFYTNTESRKGEALRDNLFAALCFYWPPLDRQLRVEGPVEPVSEAEADAYFASRDRQSRTGAWAAAQIGSAHG